MMKRIIRGLSISRIAFCNAMLFLYLCIPILKVGLKKILPFDEEICTYIVLAAIFTLYVILCVQERRIISRDFWRLYLFLVILFWGAYILHPNYKHWYDRAEYGVWDYVLRPDNGLFIYLFIRLIEDPDEILKTIKVSGWVMYLYFGRAVMKALKLGYWIDTSNYGYEIRISYNVSLGYAILIFALVFLYCALEGKSLLDWIGSVIGIGLIAVGGSRGPFLDIAIFVFLYLIYRLKESKWKSAFLLCILFGGTLLYFCYPVILQTSAVILDKLHLPSRLITKMLSGTITEKNGRQEIWSAALEMIWQKPLGYGPMGSRYVLNKYTFVAHPHNFFLEVMVDFGVVCGGIFILWLMFWTMRLLRAGRQCGWQGVFIVFLSRACQLLVSGTFWHSIGLWGAIAVGVCMSKTIRRRHIIYVR